MSEPAIKPRKEAGAISAWYDGTTFSIIPTPKYAMIRPIENWTHSCEVAWTMFKHCESSILDLGLILQLTNDSNGLGDTADVYCPFVPEPLNKRFKRDGADQFSRPND